ncbi:uncharacterized protein LOC126822221 isoform X2 [Patella vulgata]|nr:uncharacterized protein LOC126822221 isoform X2 [Patella vulgata]
MVELTKTLTTLSLLLFVFYPLNVSSEIRINEVKLWGDDQFVELKNINETAAVPLAGNFSLILIDEPPHPVDFLQVYQVVNISNFNEIKAGGLVAINVSFPDDGVLSSTETKIGVVLIKHTEDETEFKKGDNVTLENQEDALVFNHDTENSLTLLSYIVKHTLDHNVDLKKDINESLGKCNEGIMFNYMTPSKGTENSCGPAPATVTNVATLVTEATTNNSTVTTVTTMTDANNSTTVAPPTISTTNTSAVTPTTNTSAVTSATDTTTSANTAGKAVLPTNPTVNPTSVKPVDESYLQINELNLLMEDEIRFIELLGPINHAFVNETIGIEIIGGTSGSTLLDIKVNKTDVQGLALIDNLPQINETSLVIVVYHQMQKSKDWLDILMISVDGNLNSSVFEKYKKPNLHQVFIFNSSKMEFKDEKIAISKCKESGGIVKQDSRNYMLAYSTKNQTNNCTTYYHAKVQLKLTDANCSKFRDSSQKKKLIDEIVKDVGMKCQCGISSYSFQEPSIYCGVVFKANLRTVTKVQNEYYLNAFKEFVKNTKVLTVDAKEYHIDNTCFEDCYTKPGPAQNTSKGNNISTTVIVVVTCVVVFLIIVVVVILYLKKKRNGLLQFSMVRLEEDNGLLMDDTKGVRFREGSAIII